MTDERRALDAAEQAPVNREGFAGDETGRGRDQVEQRDRQTFEDDVGTDVAAQRRTPDSGSHLRSQ